MIEFESRKKIRLYQTDGGKETKSGFFCNSFFIGLDGDKGKISITTTDKSLAEKLAKNEGRDVIIKIGLDTNNFGLQQRLLDVEAVK